MCLNVSLLLLENMDHMLYSHCLTWYLAHGRHMVIKVLVEQVNESFVLYFSGN